MTPARIAKTCGGRVVRSGAPADRVVTNSSEVGPGAMFVAMVGAARDGHEFVADAFRRGATGVLVSKPVGRTEVPEGCFAVRVDDTLLALQLLAAEHRRRHRAAVVGVTGSCGKTSTKDMLGSVLGRVIPTVHSPKSYNNHVGVPLSLLQIEKSTRAAVIEIGTSAPGEIQALAQLAEPDVGIVTCVSEAHLKGLGSIDGVAKEKAGLLDGLRPGGVAILNFDDRKCRGMADSCASRVVSISVAGRADWYATDVRFHGIGTSFKLQGDRPVTLPRLGTHNVYNALMVIAAATELGVDVDDVLLGLSEATPSKRRMECRRHGDVTLFDDTYNMNPDSSRAALSALAGLQQGGRKIVVFGEMAELGDRSSDLHRELGETVAISGVDVLVTVGDRARGIAEGAIAHGLSRRNVLTHDDVSSTLDALRETVRPGDIVLCKASRRVGLDRLVDQFVRAKPVTAAAETAG